MKNYSIPLVIRAMQIKIPLRSDFWPSKNGFLQGKKWSMLVRLQRKLDLIYCLEIWHEITLQSQNVLIVKKSVNVFHHVSRRHWKNFVLRNAGKVFDEIYDKKRTVNLWKLCLYCYLREQILWNHYQCRVTNYYLLLSIVLDAPDS